MVISATPSPPIVDIDPITFTPGNWSEKQCFDVTPVASADNDIDEPDRTVNISHKVTSSDPNYGNSPSGGQYVVKLRDDDKTLVYVKPANPGPLGPITEGNSDEKFKFVVSLGRPLVAGEIAVAILGIGPWVLGALGEGLKTDDYTMALKSCQGCRLQDANQPYPFVIFSGAGAQSATLEITANDDVISEGTEKISVGSGLQWQYDKLSSPTNVGGGVGPAEPFKVLSTNILDTDGDTPSVRILPRRQLTVVGEGKPAVLTVQLSEPLDKSAEFTVKTFGGEAEAGVDYEAGPWTVTIPAGATSKSFTIRTISDREYEGSQEWGPELARESFRVWLPLEDLPTGVSAAIPYDHRIHIVDDDVPVIMKPWCVSVELYQTVEGYIRSSQKNGMKQGVADWTAARNAFDGQGTFSAAQAREKEKISSKWSPVAEALECMETPIPDSVLSLSAGSAVYEGENAEFTITANPAPVAGLSVNVTVAQSGDYLDAPGAGSRTVTFAAGATTATLALATLDDDTDEPDGSVSVTIGSGTGYTAANGQESGSITVSDDDPWPSISVAGGSGITEGGTARFTLTATPAPQSDITVNVNIADGGAFASSGAAGARQVTIGTSGTATFDVATEDDNTDEPDGAIGVAIFPGRGYTPSETHGAISIAVSDDDGPTTEVADAEKDANPAVCVSAALLADVQEYAGETGRSSPDHVERWSRVLAAFGEENTYSNNPMTVAEAQAQADRGLSRWVPVVDALECLASQPQEDGQQAEEEEGQVTPAIGIAAGNAVTEGAGAVFTLSATPAPQGDITVKVNIADSGAFASSGAAGARQVTIGTSGTATLDVTTDDDGADEPDGSITATIEAGSGYTIGTSGTASVTVSDNDEPVLSVAITPASASEGDAGQTYATVTFGLDPVRGEATSFKACLKNTGTALRGASADYQLVGAGSDTPLTLAGDCHSYTLAANAASGTFRLLVRGDADVEPDETVVVELQDPPAGVTVSGIAGTATYTILNDDAAPTACVPEQLLADAQLAASETYRSPDHVERWSRVLSAFGEENSYHNNPMTVLEAQAQADRGLPRWAPVADALECLEGAVPAEPEITIAGGADITEGAAAVFTVTASPAPTADLTVSLTVADDTNSDFLAQSDEGTQTVTIAGGQAAATLTVTTVDDSTDEADGSITATIQASSGYTPVGTNGSASIAVSDNDDPTPIPVVSIAAGSGVTEGTDASFTITASPPPATPLAVALTIGQGGDVALAGETGSRTVTIPVSGSLGIDIATVNDAVDEPDGSITATVDAGDGYTVGSPFTQTVAVADDDAVPTTPELSLSPGAAITEGGNASFTITADPVPASDITITYTVAQSGDFLAAPGAGARTATLAAGATSTTLTVATVDDTADEADGSVSVTLDTASGYSIANGKGSGAVAIADNDTPVVSITAGPGVTEGTGAAFTITADPVPAAPLDVTLTITQSGDMAASGQTGARTVTIPAAGTATFSVATEDDAADEPDGSVTATIDTGTGYSIGSPAAATVTVTDNDATTPSTGPTISIADATMNENQYNGWFTVTLSEKVAWPVHVYYATRDSSPVSAVAGQDYLAWKRSWRLRARFRPGQTETKIHVPLYNDSHDEDPETFEMVLFDAGVNGPPGVTVSIADGVAVGTITNSDPMPAAFLSRFGRTVAQQALDGIESRLAADRSPGTAATIAGQALALGTSGQAAGSPLDDLLARQAPTDTDPFGHHPPEPLSMTAREALLASSFTTTGETASGSLSIWGRAARDSFDGQEGTFSLDGTATTAMLGADYARDRWLIGMALLQSSGKGSYADTEIMPRPEGQICPPGEAGQTPCGEAIRAGDGKVKTSLTALVPYASIQTSERLRLWGALGHGSGEVTLTPKVGGTLTADTSWQMAAAGMRAELSAIGSGTLHLTSDALWSRTRSDKTHALAASDATVTRLRAGMEASWQIALESGAMLTPGLEIGARHDGGDAERGAGIELGGSLAFRDPASGFAMDLSARKLIAHDDDDFEENGLAASFIFDPRPDSARGLSVSLRQDSGEATGGVDTLFMPEVLERQDTGSAATTAEAAYGLAALAGRFTIAPHARLRMDDASRDTTLGLRLTPERGAPDLSLGLEATRREHGAAAPVHGVGLGVTLRW